jgi:type VI secretion system lysozyme-like protein
LRRSVFENLRRLCSTRLGSAPACPQFGIPPELHYAATLADGVDGIARALRDVILASEPRLGAVRVEPLETTLDGYHFQVTAQIIAGRKRESVTFRTHVGGSKIGIDA